MTWQVMHQAAVKLTNTALPCPRRSASRWGENGWVGAWSSVAASAVATEAFCPLTPAIAAPAAIKAMTRLRA